MDLPIDVKKKRRDKFTIDLLLYIILFVVCSGMKSHRGSESRRGSRRMEPRTKKMKIMMMMLWRPKKRVMKRRIVYYLALSAIRSLVAARLSRHV